MVRQRTLLLVCALVVISLVCATHAKHHLSTIATLKDQKANLQKIADNLKSTGNFNSTTVGPVVSQLDTAFHATNLPLTKISIEILENPLRLEVNATTTLWFQSVSTEFIIYYDSSDNLEIALIFDTMGSLSTTWELIFYKGVPSWLNGITGSDSLEVEFNSGSQFGIPKGLTILGQATVTSQSSLRKVFEIFQSGSSNIQVTASLFIPIYSSSAAQSSTLSLTEAGTVNLTSHLQVSSFAVNFCDNCAQPISVAGDFAYFPTNANPVTFELSGVYNDKAESVALAGSMATKWTPMGIKWFTFTQASTKLLIDLSPISLVSLTLQGSGTTTINPSAPVTALLSITGPSLENDLLEITNVPFDSKPFSLRSIWTTITNQTHANSYPTLLDEVQVHGEAKVVIATYSSGSITEGLSLSIAAELTDDAKTLVAPLKVFNSHATSKTYDFTLSLFVPLFNWNVDAIKFVLQETTPIALGDYVEVEGFGVQVTFVSGLTIELVSVFDIYFGKKSTTSPAVFDVTGEFQAGTAITSFKGSIAAPWVHPFGINWMTFQTADIEFDLDGVEIQDIILEGTIALSFVTGPPVSAKLQFGSSLVDWYFQLTNIPITDFNSGYKAITGHDIPKDLNGIKTTGSASLVLADYDSPAGPEGLTINVNVIFTSGSTLHSFASYVAADQHQLNYDLNLFAPLFSDAPENILVKFSETDPFNILSNFICDNYQIQVQVDFPNFPQFQLNANFELTIKNNPSPLTLSLNSNWVSPEDASITLSGQMPMNWVDPFGAKWLTLTEMTGTITLAIPAAIQNFALAGTADLHFASTPSGSAAVSVDFMNDFTEAILSVSLNNLWTVDEIASTVLLGKPLPSNLKDVTLLKDVDLSFTLNTMSGVSFSASGNLENEIYGHLVKNAYFYPKSKLWTPQSTFSVSLNLPIFTSNPLDISVSVTIDDNITLTHDITMLDVSFSLQVEPIAVSLSTSVIGHFKKNPTLRFDFSGSFSADGSFKVEGDMMGTWDNAFGFKGFNLSNVIAEFGLSPEMCAVDACISDLGFGAKLAFASETLSFDGNAAAPDFLDIYLAGGIAVPLNIKTIADVWNYIDPSQPVNVTSIPTDWGMVGVSFYLAPEDGTFGPITYTAGFGITGTLTVLDMELIASVNCSADTFTCGFGFNVDVSKEEFGAMIKKELALSYPNSSIGYDIFSVNDASLTEWSQKHVATGINPRWTIGLTVLDKKHDLDFRVAQWTLASSFHDFFHEWLAHIFDGAIKASQQATIISSNF